MDSRLLNTLPSEDLLVLFFSVVVRILLNQRRGFLVISQVVAAGISPGRIEQLEITSLSRNMGLGGGRGHGVNDIVVVVVAILLNVGLSSIER